MDIDKLIRVVDSILTSAGIIAPTRTPHRSERLASSSARRCVRPENFILANDAEKELCEQIQAADDALSYLTRQSAGRFYQAMADAGFCKIDNGWRQSQEPELDRLHFTASCAGPWVSLAAAAELEWQRVLVASGYHAERDGQPPAIVMPLGSSPSLIYLLTCVARAWERVSATLAFVRCRMHDSSGDLQDYLHGRNRRADQQHRRVVDLVLTATNVLQE